MPERQPAEFVPISGATRFSFACHPAVPCFTECCRQLDLALTPYDVLRLKNRLKMPSARFLEQYVITEWDPQLLFPQCYLTMVDDGRASCVFVSPAGCTVYSDRPGACRAYPVGRGASAGRDGRIEETLVLVREPHCHGFSENPGQTADEYFAGQGLREYNRFNDAILAVTQHQRFRTGSRPDRRHLDRFILALYNLDDFRRELNNGAITLRRPFTPEELRGLTGDDEQLLLLGIRWLQQEFFNE